MEVLNNVGIAVSTTRKREGYWQEIQKNFIEFMPTEIENFYFDFRVDEDLRGVAYSKNESIKYLLSKGCEYIFLFDDDVKLLRNGFFHWVYRVHKASNIHHFIYLNPKKHKPISEERYLNHTVLNSRSGSGCFLFLTRKAVEKVGGYDLDLKGYGFNHVDYSNRLHFMMGREPHQYTTIKGMDTYLFSYDFDGKPLKQTLTKAQKQKWIEKNNPIFKAKANNLNRFCAL